MSALVLTESCQVLFSHRRFVKQTHQTSLGARADSVDVISQGRIFCAAVRFSYAPCFGSSQALRDVALALTVEPLGTYLVTYFDILVCESQDGSGSL